MDEFVRRVYERGKITIPKELRDIYGVTDGDMVKLKIVEVVRAAERLRGRRAEDLTFEIEVADDDDRKEVA